jgi:hypothetical protein
VPVMNRYRDWQFGVYHRTTAAFPESIAIVPEEHCRLHSFTGPSERTIETSRFASHAGLPSWRDCAVPFGVARGTGRWPTND